MFSDTSDDTMFEKIRKERGKAKKKIASQRQRSRNSETSEDSSLEKVRKERDKGNGFMKNARFQTFSHGIKKMTQAGSWQSAQSSNRTTAENR